ncbi:MAG: hypothetical protein PHP65_00035 [Bacilli bacterium]|nr:hypothetical protein [Bacilli bacterium]
MKGLMKIFLTIIVLFFGVVLVSCKSVEHAPNEVKTYGNWINVDTYYDEIELNWEQSYFVHETLRVDIPQDWFGWGHKSDFDDLDKHDLVYQYKKRTITYYSNDTTVETELRDLDYENPTESTVNLHISVVGINVESKLLIQDEFINDYYFKYDFNNDYNNHCYFCIAKNDVNQLQSGSYNEIRLNLTILTHIDGSKSFKLKTEDGITEVGYYSSVGIYFNPNLT